MQAGKIVGDDAQMPKIIQKPYLDAKWYFNAVFRAYMACVVYQCYLIDEAQRIKSTDILLKAFHCFRWF